MANWCCHATPPKSPPPKAHKSDVTMALSDTPIFFGHRPSGSVKCLERRWWWIGRLSAFCIPDERLAGDSALATTRCESRRICRDQRKAKRPDGVWGKAGRQWGKSHYVEFLGVLWVVLIMLPQVGKVAVSEYGVVVV